MPKTDYIHEAGELLASWINGNRKTVVGELLDPGRPKTSSVLLTAALAMTLPDGEREPFLTLLDSRNQERLLDDSPPSDNHEFDR
jgi:hypothetical protein